MKFSPIFVALASAVAAFASQAATYQLTELSPVTSHKFSYGTAINNQNQAVGNLTGQFNYPIDLAAIDYTSTTITGALTAAEIEEVKKGVVSAKALAALSAHLRGNASTYSVQRYAEIFAADLNNATLIPIRETASVPTNNEYMVGINDLEQRIGFATAPFTKSSFTPAPTTATPNPAEQKLWVPAPMHHAGYVLTSREKHLLPPLYTNYGGGFSVARAINNTGTVVGLGSVGMSQTTIDALVKSCDGATEPAAICYYRSALAGSYENTGLVWKLDGAGKPGTPTALKYFGDKYSGAPHTNKDYPEVTYLSMPHDVNDRGLIVGASVYSDSSDIRARLFGGFFRDEIYWDFHAAVFNGNDLKPIIDVTDKSWLRSFATAVNNKDMIAGYAVKNINSAERNRLFVYDNNAKALTFVTDLFPSASTVPEAINDNNIVVGSTETFTDGSSNRRNVAFMYDIASKTFTDLNSTLPCKSPYILVNANDINEKNVILATAIKEVDKRDLKGDVVKDSTGKTEKEYVTVAVRLTPVPGGSKETCENQEATEVKRKGGVGSWGLLGALLGLWGWRRFRGQSSKNN